jgi:hybrid cluster-associated redox disulfide protein
MQVYAFGINLRSLRGRKDRHREWRDPRRVSPTEVLDMPVADLLGERPAARRVLVSRGMACPGCPFARFETVAEVAAIYRCDALELAGSLADARPFPDDHEGVRP